MRQIFIVNATQVVTSETHPEGLFSVVSGFPKSFDSRSYPSADGNPNGDEEKALSMAKSAYLAQLSTNYANSNPTRVMMVVTLERADGRQIMRECIGAFPYDRTRRGDGTYWRIIYRFNIEIMNITRGSN